MANWRNRPVDAHEIQALIRYHCAVVIEAIDAGGIKPSKIGTLQATIGRLVQLANDLGRCPTEKE